MDIGSSLCESGRKGAGPKLLSAVFGKSLLTRSRTPPPQRQQATVTNRGACAPDAAQASATEVPIGRLSSSSAPCDRHELTQPSITYGLPRDFLEHYELGHVLGQGGNAVVIRAISRRNGREYACKCLPKVLSSLTPQRTQPYRCMQTQTALLVRGHRCSRTHRLQSSRGQAISRPCAGSWTPSGASAAR